MSNGTGGRDGREKNDERNRSGRDRSQQSEGQKCQKQRRRSLERRLLQRLSQLLKEQQQLLLAWLQSIPLPKQLPERLAMKQRQSCAKKWQQRRRGSASWDASSLHAQCEPHVRGRAA